MQNLKKLYLNIFSELLFRKNKNEELKQSIKLKLQIDLKLTSV